MKILSISDDKMTTRGELIEYPAELIGGRNLIVNSDFREGDFQWSMWYGAVFNGVNVILTSGSLIFQSTRMQTNMQPKIGPNEQATASIRARGTGGVRARWGAAGANIPYQQVSENYDLYVFNIPRDGNTNITFEADVNSDVEIEWVKLEKGNKATPWSPAPEDLGLSYPDRAKEFKPSISEDGILAPAFDESGVLSFSINRTTAQEFIENSNL